MGEIKNRHDFVLFFDVQDGNPNGDPDAGNLPRIDPETGHGLVTDVCLKRKLRNFVLLKTQGADGYDVFVKEKAVLNLLIDAARDRVEKELPKAPDGEKTQRTTEVMCRKFYDVRTFGAVMTTGKNAGQVRGPVQLTFSRSVDPITTLEHSITRMAVATEKEAADQKGENRTMGRKSTVPYGLYRCHGFVSPALARQTGFTQADLDLLWEGLVNMFEHDRSSARGLMNARRLVVFTHESDLGNAPAFALFESVKARRRDAGAPPRSFEDYDLLVPRNGDLPRGVSVEVRP
jgi:CRISPR-associated protein Csd2